MERLKNLNPLGPECQWVLGSKETVKLTTKKYVDLFPDQEKKPRVVMSRASFTSSREEKNQIPQGSKNFKAPRPTI